MSSFKTRLGFDTLETREVPAVLKPDFNPLTGALTVTIDPRDGQTYAKVQNYFGNVQVNNELVKVNGQPIVPAQVKSITIQGSNTGDTIDLGGVSSEPRSGFVNLDNKITIYGNGGNDGIGGSQFADKIYGGAGDDTIYGRGGNDTIDGGANNDRLYGQDGVNILKGGDGQDTLFGDGSRLSFNKFYGDANDQIFHVSSSRDRVFGGRVMNRIG